jgi:hypothetical protein
MRWDGLFADLEAQAQALDDAGRAAEVAERARGETSQLRLVDRLRPAVGSAIRVECVGDLTLRGTLNRLGPDWLLIGESTGGEALVVLAAVQSCGGLSRLSSVPHTEGLLDSRLGIRSSLRAIAVDRSGVRLQLRSGSTLDGTLDRVGSDFVELAAHPSGEPRRRGEVRDVLVVALAELAAVRRRDHALAR